MTSMLDSNSIMERNILSLYKLCDIWNNLIFPITMLQLIIWFLFLKTYQDAVNGTNGGIEKGDTEKNGGGEKWRNSYVPYEEEYTNQ